MAGRQERELRWQRWTFSAEELDRAREDAYNSAKSKLSSLRTPEQKPIKPLGIEPGIQLVLFYSPKIPELGRLCNAPVEVCWTAVVYFQRFFAVRSPMEFDPVPMMFACLHLACKIEEVFHEITLDRILEAADFGKDPAMRVKVSNLELPLLDGVGFALMVEPKPNTVLKFLEAELGPTMREHLGDVNFQPSPVEPTTQVAAGSEEDGAEKNIKLGTLLDAAHDLAVQLCARTDVILRWPTSMIFAAALRSCLDAEAAKADENDDAGGKRIAAAKAASQAIITLIESQMCESSHASVKPLLLGLEKKFKGMADSEPASQASVKDAAIAGRRCHKFFDKLRADPSEKTEGAKKDRKRKADQK